MSGIEFGKTKEGNTVTKYLLKNKNGMEVAVIDLGATIVSVLVPDREGVNRDVVMLCWDMIHHRNIRITPVILGR